MRRVCALLVVATIAIFTSSGCVSYSTLHTAEPVPEGQTEGAVSGSFYGLSADGESLELPNTELAIRYGVSEDSDLGFKVYPLGVAFDYNHVLVEDEGFLLSANPYISGTRIVGGDASVTYGFALFNILADVVRSEAATVTLGVKPGFFYGIGTADDEFASSTGAVVGGMAGVRLDLGATMTIMPNIDIITPVENFGDGWMYNFGLAFMF